MRVSRKHEATALTASGLFARPRIHVVDNPLAHSRVRIVVRISGPRPNVFGDAPVMLTGCDDRIVVLRALHGLVRAVRDEFVRGRLARGLVDDGELRNDLRLVERREFARARLHLPFERPDEAVVILHAAFE